MSEQKNTVSIQLNGEDRQVARGATIPEVLRAENIDPSTTGIAVAVNDAVIRRPSWEETTVNAGDRVEIVTANQGG